MNDLIVMKNQINCLWSENWMYRKAQLLLE